MSDTLVEFFEVMYEYFGQVAIIKFVKDRQEQGQLQNVEWLSCNGCELESPFLDNACLVCGGM